MFYRLVDLVDEPPFLKYSKGFIIIPKGTTILETVVDFSGIQFGFCQVSEIEVCKA